jgi:uncharacterized MAPEG superfamily protein
MTLAYWCVLMAAILPYLFTGLAKFGPKDPADQPAPKYDNHAPRAHLDKLTGRRLRAHWAQLNSTHVDGWNLVLHRPVRGQRLSAATGPSIAVSWLP